jgi:hypothetical protein
VAFELAEEPSAPAALREDFQVAVDETEISLAVDGRDRGVYRERMRLPIGAHKVRLVRFEKLG